MSFVSLRFSYCHLPRESTSDAARVSATTAAAEGRTGWAVLGLVVIVGFASLSDSF
jgi:hypothetical protein